MKTGLAWPPESWGVPAAPRSYVRNVAVRLGSSGLVVPARFISSVWSLYLAMATSGRLSIAPASSWRNGGNSSSASGTSI